MNIVLLIIIFTVIVVILGTVFKKLIKILATMFLLLIIVIGVFGFLVYQDMMILQENLATKDSIFLFEKDGEYIAGFRAKGFGVEKQMLSEIELSQINLENSEVYKTFVMHVDEYADVGEYESLFADIAKNLGESIANGAIDVYPETPFFKALKKIPFLQSIVAY